MTFVQIVKSPTGWNAKYQSGPRADQIRQLFGTDTLPLPYTLELSLKQATEKFIKNTKGAASSGLAGQVVLK